MLEALADRAVIAIRNARNQEQLTLASLGDLAGSWLHWIYGQVGLIRSKAIDIQHGKSVDDESKLIAEGIQQLTEQIKEEAQKLQSWIPDEPKPINLHQVVEVAWNKVRIPPKVTIMSHVLLGEDLPMVLGGEQQLAHVLINLIQNAVDAMPHGGAISVTGKLVQFEGESWVALSVRDSGTGIPDEIRDRIFDRSFTTKKKSEKGLGFGLWWARLYIQRLGGQLTFESKPGEWTQFDLALPVYRSNTKSGQ
jgi:signal transduction histidine kinase